MSRDVAPRLATEAEYPEVVDLLERVFGYNDGGMPEQIPNWFDDSRPERYAVIERDGAIVSTVGCLPQTFVIGDNDISWWGIGNVATANRYRGNGYMTVLLEFWLDHLRDNDVPLAELGGLTKRYNRFGWENAGREYIFSVNYPTFSDGDVADGTVRRYRGTQRDLELVTGIHRDEAYRVRRSDEEFDALLNQRGVETLLYTGEAGPAYLAFNREVPSGRYSSASPHSRVVPEFGGSESGLDALLGHLWTQHGIGDIGVPVHPTHERTDFFRRLSRSWSLRPQRMVRIVDLHGVLDGYTVQMTDRWRSSPRSGGGEITFDIEDADGDPVTISYETTDVMVESDPSADPDVRLDRLSMTQLLFGFPEAFSNIKANYPFLEDVLPLDFHIWLLEGP